MLYKHLLDLEVPYALVEKAKTIILPQEYGIYRPCNWYYLLLGSCGVTVFLGFRGLMASSLLDIKPCYFIKW